MSKTSAWLTVPLFLLTAACNPISESKPKPPTIRGIAADMTADEIRRMGGWSEMVFTTTPYGSSPYFAYLPHKDGFEYYYISKTLIGDTVGFSWRFSLPSRITFDAALSDTLEQFSEYGDPLIVRKNSGMTDERIEVFYNCGDCKNIKEPNCGGWKATAAELCLILDSYRSEKFLVGMWYNAEAAEAEDRWKDRNRDKVKF